MIGLAGGEAECGNEVPGGRDVAGSRRLLEEADGQSTGGAVWRMKREEGRHRD